MNKKSKLIIFITLGVIGTATLIVLWFVTYNMLNNVIVNTEKRGLAKYVIEFIETDKTFENEYGEVEAVYIDDIQNFTKAECNVYIIARVIMKNGDLYYVEAEIPGNDVLYKSIKKVKQ